MRALDTYHEPFPFQCNLNAFIQARNITFMLQSKPKKFDGFDEWYEEKRKEMRGNPLLKRFVEARGAGWGFSLYSFLRCRCIVSFFCLLSWGSRRLVALKFEVHRWL